MQVSLNQRYRKTARWLFGRHLHVENLEPRNAPGVFLISLPGLLPGLTLDAILPDEQAQPPAATKTDTAHHSQHDQPAGTAWVTSDRFPAVHDALYADLARRQIAARSNNAPAHAPTDTSAFDRSFHALATERWSALDLDRFASPNEEPILKTQTAAPIRPVTAAVAGGGHASASGGAPADGGKTIKGTGVISESGPVSQPQSNDGNDSRPLYQTAADAGLLLVDAAGNPFNVALDANTLIIGAATWCGACAQFKQTLANPAALAEIQGLRLIFAFGNEGGSGPGGVQYAEFLQGLPGDVVFLAAGSVQPDSFPNAFNPATGRFDQHPVDAIQSWWLAQNAQKGTGVISGVESPSQVSSTTGNDSRPLLSPAPGSVPNSTAAGELGTDPLAPALTLVDAAGAPLNIAPDANTLIVGAATWCGATQKFVAALHQPEIAAQLDGLRIVFAFGNEGGDGPGGVKNADFLSGLPGDVAFLAPSSVRPERLPTVYNPATGAFDLTAVEAVNAWATGALLTGFTCGNKNPGSVPSPGSVPFSGSAEKGTDPLPAASPPLCPAVNADYNADRLVNAADYVAWRKFDGSQGPGLPADGTGNQIVDQEDYDLWQSEFGHSAYCFEITAPSGTVNTATPLITWTASLDAIAYSVYVATDSGCVNRIQSYEGLGAGTLQQATSPLANGTYYACVYADNPSASPSLLAAKNNPREFIVDAPLPMEHVVFITSSSYGVNPAAEPIPGIDSFGGLVSADDLCNQHGQAAHMINNFGNLTYKALLSNATVDARDRMPIEGRVVNSIGEKIADDFADLWDGSLDVALRYNENGFGLPANTVFWTGSNQFGVKSQHCQNWQQTISQDANFGLNQLSNLWFNQGTVPCGGSNRIVCISEPKPQ